MIAGGIKYYSFKGKMSGNVGFHRAGTIMAALSSSTDAHYGGRWTAIAVHGRPLCCAYRGCNRITSAADEVTGTCYGCIINDTGYSTVFHCEIAIIFNKSRSLRAFVLWKCWKVLFYFFSKFYSNLRVGILYQRCIR